MKTLLMERKLWIKMRLFKFWNENGDEKEKEVIFKSSNGSIQGDYKDELIGVEYVSKRTTN